MPTLGLKLADKTYVWSQPMNEAAILQHAAHEKVKTVLSGFVFFVLIFFIVLTFLLLYLQGIDHFSFLTFWLSPSWAGLCAYLAIFFSLFLWYHQKSSVQKTTQMPEGEEAVPEILSLDTETRTINIGSFFSSSAMKCVESGYELALRFKHAHVDPLHLFVGCIEDERVLIVFGRLGVSIQSIQDPIGRRLSTRELGSPVIFSEEAQRVLLESFRHACQARDQTVTPLEIFVASYLADPFVQELLLEQSVSQEQFLNMIEWVRIHERIRERYERFRKAALYKPTGPMNRSMTAVATPMLDAVSEDLTTAAVEGRLPLLIEREEELHEIFRIIEGGKQSVMLVGPSGVGKRAIIAGIAELMVEEKVPKILQDKRLVRISIPHLISGATPADAQERLLVVLGEVARSRNIILAITDLEQLITTPGGHEATDLGSTLVDFLSRSGVFVIATTTPEASASVVEHSILGRVFQKIDIHEPAITSAIHMLESKIGSMEYEHQVIFSYGAVEKAVTLSDRYMHESYLPAKAIEIARESALEVAKTKGKDALVAPQDVAAIVTAKTGIPMSAVQTDETQKLLSLETRMHDRVIGQNEAVSAVSAALRRARTQLAGNTRPIAVFLFLGPTGVGKTELAKTLAETYFGSEEAMIRLDMSEYQDVSSIHRMIGIPGSGEGGLLTEAVRKKPFSIVLLDEFEKAHPDILNIFLAVFDDGRLTDATGRTIDFTSTIIIATSNAGSSFIQQALARGEEMDTIKTQVIEQELKGVYRPELLNRFDSVIMFKPLSQEDILAITQLFMNQVSKQLEPKGIGFRATQEAMEELAHKGFDPQFGARPLRRVVQEEVDNAIADALLQGTVKRRDTIVLEKGGVINIEHAPEL